MLEPYHIHGLRLIHDWGLLGLLFTSFLGSTIFVPFSTEVAILILVQTGVNKIAILLVATAGSVGGTLVNYYIGYKGIRLADRYLKKEDMEKAHNLMEKYGWAGIFTALAIPISLPVDPLTILCGATKMHLKKFITVVAAAKALKYSLVLELLTMIVK